MPLQAGDSWGPAAPRHTLQQRSHSRERVFFRDAAECSALASVSGRRGAPWKLYRRMAQKLPSMAEART